MNYRQWKKNYKKANGYNPTVEFDKRKMNKIMAKAFNNIDVNATLLSFCNNLKLAMAEVFEGFAKTFNNAAEILRTTAERDGNANE